MPNPMKRLPGIRVLALPFAGIKPSSIPEVTIEPVGIGISTVFFLVNRA